MAEFSNQPMDEKPALTENNNFAKIARNLIIGIVVVIAIVISGAYYWSQKQIKEENASIALSKAIGPETIQKVIDQYPNTAASNSALLLLAASHQQKQDFTGAADLYSRFVQKNPGSPLSAASQFAQAQCLEAAGKKVEAQAAYLSIINGKPTNPFAGGAAVASARLYLADKNTQAARQVLTDFITRDSSSSYLGEANALLRRLPQDTKK